jgi:hydroxyethylthiazole kinase-like uncharacterized protein yjeF
MIRTLPRKDMLPHALYRAEQVREFDRIAIQELGTPGVTLMERAGAAAFTALRQRWPQARRVVVLCGPGNNGGDGYVVARLAWQAGLDVRVIEPGDPSRIRGDARRALERLAGTGCPRSPFDGSLPRSMDVIVDGLFGTGLERDLREPWSTAVALTRTAGATVLALDIPSGLHSDTGRILGSAVRADLTASFIGLKLGLFTGAGPEHCGEIRFSDLGVPASLYARQVLAGKRLEWRHLAHLLPARSRTAHKGDFGHVLVIGGERGYSGAPRMAAEAAARSGAGLVTVATRPEHAAQLNLTRPELMCRGVAGPGELEELIGRASVLAIGPGLGTSSWSHSLWVRACDSELPMLVDADALNLLARAPVAARSSWVLTPHPGEAARLLGCKVSEVEADRVAAVRKLQCRFGGVVVLKGAGTLIQGGPDLPVGICSQGNPGMASGGMGDVLSGVVAALLAQGLEPFDAARAGVCLHAAAADAAAFDGERGLLASDLFGYLRRLVNASPGRW